MVELGRDRSGGKKSKDLYQIKSHQEIMAEIENAGGRSRSAMSRERARHGGSDGTV